MSNHNYYYGYIRDLDEIIRQVDIVCEILDTTKVFPNSRLMVLETLAQETKLGLVKDTTKKAGMGIAQFDYIGFHDTKVRSKYRFTKIVKKFGINLNLVKWENLRYNPFLSIIFCRLKYKLVPAPIPDTIEGRWLYYKKWFNSAKGKAKREQYLDSAKYVQTLLEKS